jgi:hypothetical protein
VDHRIKDIGIIGAGGEGEGKLHEWISFLVFGLW